METPKPIEIKCDKCIHKNVCSIFDALIVDAMMENSVLNDCAHFEEERKEGKQVVDEADAGEFGRYPAYIEFHCPNCGESYSHN